LDSLWPLQCLETQILCFTNEDINCAEQKLVSTKVHPLASLTVISQDEKAGLLKARPVREDEFCGFLEAFF
jgi:hypothetical protein